MEVTIPHNFKTPTPYQVSYLGSDKPFSILVWHRRARKSRTALNKQIMKILQRKEPGVCYYILPTYRQAKQVIWDALINDHVPEAIYDKKNDSELAVYYKNGVIQRFIGAEDPDKHRGTNPFDVVFDEYSEMPEQIWTAIFQPVLRENKGTATFVFTPKGKNHSWKLVQLARDNPEEWYVDIQTVKDTGMFTDSELDEIRRNTPQALFNQEYMCDFVESAGQFFRRITQNTYDKDTILPEQGDFQIGVDLAKYNDWTVITPFNLNTFIVYNQERFNQVDWNLQKARIEATARRFSDALVMPDSTGLGDPIVEDLHQRGVRIGNDGAGFKFTETSRRQLLDNLAILLEQDKIKIPNDEGLISELESFRFELSETGKIKVTVPDGLHDDRVMSLALAVWEARQLKRDPYFENQIYQNRQRTNTFK